MKKSIVIGVIFVVIIVGAGVILSKTNNETPPKTQEVELEPIENADSMPVGISLKDYSGNSVSLADYIGKPLVVNSWAIWCPFCVEELKDFAKVQKELGDDIIFIAINRAESRDRAKNFTDNLGVTDDFVFLLDSRDAFYRKIGGFTMPETVFVDRLGNIRIYKRGVMDIEEIRTKAQQILAE